MNEGKFSVGVNYLPTRSAQQMWKRFDGGEIREDFARLRELGLSPVRIFLLWEDFQLETNKVNMRSLDKLVEVAQHSMDMGVDLWITLFVGHLMEVNHLPFWILEASPGEVTVPTLVGSTLLPLVAKDLFEDREILQAQKLMIREVAAALRGHPNLFCWEFGSQLSRVRSSKNPQAMEGWLASLNEELKGRDDRTPMTVGLSPEDLYEQGLFAPHILAGHCDLLSIAFFPNTSQWSRGPTDVTALVFVVEMIRWLSRRDDMPIWVEAVGVPCGHQGETQWMVDDETAAEFAKDALRALWNTGVQGGLWWCYGDFYGDFLEGPPFNERPWWGKYGLFSTDQRPKSVLEAVTSLSSMEKKSPSDMGEWFDLEHEEYWKEPSYHFQRLLKRFDEDFQLHGQ